MAISSETSSGPRRFQRSVQQDTRILVSEDPFIASFLCAMLQRHGYQVVASESAAAADLLSAGKLQADVVVTNNPIAFLPFAATLPLLYIAANPEPALALRFANSRVLRKPFRNEDLLHAVEQLAQPVVP